MSFYHSFQWFLSKYFSTNNQKMIQFKTNLSFGFSLKRKRQVTETMVSRSISKLLVVAKEIVKTRLLKS